MHNACIFPSEDPAVFTLSSPRAVRYWSPNFESRPSSSPAAGTPAPCRKFHLPDSVVRELESCAGDLGITPAEAVQAGIAALRKLENARIRDIPVSVGKGTLSLRGRIVARTVIHGSQWTFIRCTDGSVAGSSKEALLVAPTAARLLDEVEHLTREAVPADIAKALRDANAQGLGE